MQQVLHLSRGYMKVYIDYNGCHCAAAYVNDNNTKVKEQTMFGSPIDFMRMVLDTLIKRGAYKTVGLMISEAAIIELEADTSDVADIVERMKWFDYINIFQSEKAVQYALELYDKLEPTEKYAAMAKGNKHLLYLFDKFELE